MKTEAELKIDVEVKRVEWIKNKSRVLIRLSCETNLLILTPKEARQLVQELTDKAAICAMENGGSNNRTI